MPPVQGNSTPFKGVIGWRHSNVHVHMPVPMLFVPHVDLYKRGSSDAGCTRRGQGTLVISGAYTASNNVSTAMQLLAMPSCHCCRYELCRIVFIREDFNPKV